MLKIKLTIDIKHIATSCNFLYFLAKLPVKISRRGNKIMIDICGSILTKNIIKIDKL